MAKTSLSVKLVDYTPNPEKVVADAARVCYAGDEKIEELFGQNLDSIDDARMIRTLIKMNHLSPLEHAKWTYFI